MIGGTPSWIDAQVHSHHIIDGDTVHLTPIAGGRWFGPDWPVRCRSDGALTLRLAALDAPELSFSAAPPALRHQPLAYAVAATEAFRAALCSASSCRDLRRIDAEPVEVTACVLAVDVYQRAVGVLCTGSGRANADCVESINAQLLASGAAYPDFHAQLPDDWLSTLDRHCKGARRAGLGVWSADRSSQPIALGALDRLTQDQLILPRLFRRLTEFARHQGLPIAAGVAGAAPLAPLFREYLERRERTVFLRDRRVSCPFVECLEFADDFCRIPGDVENFLYQSGQGERKLT